MTITWTDAQARALELVELERALSGITLEQAHVVVYEQMRARTRVLTALDVDPEVQEGGSVLWGAVFAARYGITAGSYDDFLRKITPMAAEYKEPMD